MRYVILTVILLGALPASATTRFVSQSGGFFSGGTACNGQTAISVATFNSTSNSAGDIDWLCGTITSQLAPFGNGAGGNPVSIKFDTGAGISMAAIPTSGGITTSNSHYVIDGGGGSCGWTSTGGNSTCAVGYIQSTANGSGLANQIASVGIEVSTATDVEVKGLRIGPLYTHTSTSDNTQSPPGPIAVHFNGTNTINIHNNTIDDCAWCLTGNVATLTVSNNEIYNSDHGVGLGGTNSGVNIHDNHFHDWVNWDTIANTFHHDGIHLFDISGLTFNGANEYNNLFDGDQGNNLTAAIYNEHAAATGTIQNIVWYNNIVIAFTGRFSNLGWLACWNTAGSGTGTTCSGYNNSVYGYYVAGSGTCIGITGWTGLTLENNSFANCQNNIGVDSTTTITTIDYNSYDDIGTDHGIDGSANTFSWHGSQFSSFTTWKTDCSCDSHAIFNTIANLKLNGSNAHQLSGSPVIGAGLNLTSLSITPLDSDILGNARPGGVTAWDIGAYFGAQSVGTFATPVSAINP